MTYSGGCLCGSLRFESEQAPLETAYCHCSICRRSTGALMLAFASFPADSFTYVEGEPAIYLSSLKGQREFCNQCGTQICFREAGQAETVDVNSGTLDQLESVVPQYHMYHADRVAWLEIDDQLPRYDKER